MDVAEKHKWREEQAEKAMRNFKAHGKTAGHDKAGKMSQRRVSKQQANHSRELSSDSSIEAFVNNGVHNAFAVAEKSIKDNFHPYAISLLLSLSAEQLGILQ